MSKQANKTMIGVFVLGAIGLALAAVVLLGSGKFFRKTYIAVCYFEGSVGGLNVGAPVVFKGVKIGSVTDVVLRVDSLNLTFSIPVYIEIEPDKFTVIGPLPKKMGQNLKTLIDKGLRAQLEMQSIVTGQMQVSLDYYPNKPAKFVGADTRYPEIPTVPTPMQELAQKIQKIPLDEIFQKILSAVEGIERVVNSPEITQTLQSVSKAAEEAKSLVKNVNSQVTPLASNVNDTVKDFQKLVRNLDQQTSTLALTLGEAVKDVRSMVQNVDGQVKPLASGIEGTMKEVQNLARNAGAKIDQFGLSVEKTLEAASTALHEAQATLHTVGGNTGEDSPLIYQTMQTLKELSAAARSLRTLADYLERHPEAAIRGKK